MKACYLSLLEDYFLSHRLLPQLFQLYKDAADPSFDHVSIGPHLEKLDQLRVEGMHCAEKHCRKLYMGTLAYSPTLMLWFDKKIYGAWSLKSYLEGTSPHAVSAAWRTAAVLFSPSQYPLRWHSITTKQHKRSTKISSQKPPS